MKRATQAGLVIAGLALVVLFGREAAVRLPSFAGWVQSLGPWGPLAFVGGYTVASLLLIPVLLLTFAAGVLWGFGFGVLYSMLGAAVGSTCAFLAARFIIRGLVERYVTRHPRLAAIDRAVGTEGTRLVFLLRLSPAVPFVFLNYVLGVSRISLRDYTVGLIGMVPPVAMYVYAGKAVGDFTVLASGAAPPRGPAYYIALVVGMLATVAATVLITRAASRAIAVTDG